MNGDKLPVCKPCLEKKKQAGTPFECMSCHQWKAAEGFHYIQMGNRHLRRVCADCHDKRRCVGPCKLLKPVNDFTEDQWKKALKQQGKCKECMTRNCETKECNKCGEKRTREFFPSDSWRRLVGRICVECLPKNQTSRICIKCRKEKARKCFSGPAWEDATKRVCTDCLFKAHTSSTKP